MTEVIHWAIDKFERKGTLIFSFGFVFLPNQKIRNVRFRFVYDEPEKRDEVLLAEFGKPRPDVDSAYPNAEQAASSGYLLVGALSESTSLSRVVLECEAEQGNVIYQELPKKLFLSDLQVHVSHKRRAGFASKLYLLRKAYFLAKDGKLRLLFAKSKRYLGSPKSSNFDETSCNKLLRRGQPILVIVDHNLGGGANQYRNQLVKVKIEAGFTVILVSFNLLSLNRFADVYADGEIARFNVDSFDFLLKYLKDLKVHEIVFNNAVSLPEPDKLPAFLVSLKSFTKATLTVLVHDFYMVCPSHFLLDNQAKYCGIPSISTCEACLPTNNQGFVSFFPKRDIQHWRSSWQVLLNSADNILAFSQNSSDLLHKAYPSLSVDRVQVKPHTVSYLRSNVTPHMVRRPLVIGVVGQIGFHKGASIVQNLASLIKQRALDVKILVIGSIEVRCEKSVVSETGPYKQSDLPNLIANNQVSFAFFPSIWPETFSYVVEELTILGVPIAAFNIGAPAERLRKHSNSLLIEVVDTDAILDHLLGFHDRLLLESKT
jgi:glycosyltransferase involved in cell wall biosynthesis